jgi:ATP-utilising chromatin assembly and remodelling N-terminal/Williams-Beuren syndrome DDT (WSD), D-TOX E motif/DDT domain/WSTF, HB1, Itc1p, MBD9 motif 1
MVLLRRKVVEVVVPDHEPDLDSRVWYIPRTQEYFEDYDQYLGRMDFYNQKKFICELTGHSCLTYFEALDSESRETLQVMSSFPEVLKEPILRKVQFSQISRLDALVDFVYNSLKSEFYPGEVAIAKVRDQRIKVIVREKAKFSSITLPNGEVRPPYSRCRVELVANSSQELAVDESQLARDRKMFTKLILRTFIKHAVARESWTGAPWLVKDEYARMYRIDQTVPLHLLRSKQISHEKKKDKSAALKETSSPTAKRSPAPDDDNASTPPKKKKGDHQHHRHHHHRHNNEVQATGQGIDNTTPVPSHPHKPGSKEAIHEDLELQMDPALKRNPLKWEHVIGHNDYRNLIGKLIEVWVFINVYHEPLLMDPFTFDDFVDALRLSNDSTDCSLINEIHCALLSVLVDLDEAEFAVPLPPQEETNRNINGNGVIDHKEDKQDDQNDVRDEENQDKSDKDKDSDVESTASSPEEIPPVNKVSAFLSYQNSDWKERLRKRMFKDGGWQQILIGVLHTVSYVDEWSDTCNAALNELASLERPVALFAAHEGYYNLSFENRTNILCILCSLMTGSMAVRSYMEKCMEETSKLKRERLERQREYRALQDQIKGIEEEKRQFLNVGKKKSSKEVKKADTPQVKKEQSGAAPEDTEEEDIDVNNKPAPSDDDFVLKKFLEDIEALTVKSNLIQEQNKSQEDELARLDCQRLKLLGKDRYYNRYWWFEGNGMKRVTTAVGETTKSKKEGEDNEDFDHRKQDDDAEDAEDAEEVEKEESAVDYSMGRLWVQGPTDEDLYTFLGWSKDLEVLKRQNKLGAYVCGFDGRVLIDVYGHPVLHMLPMERKRLEEMDMFLTSTEDWGYYDTQEDIDTLVAWLNPFGTRESALRKELMRAMPWIAASMKQRQEDLRVDEEKRMLTIEAQLEEEMKSSEDGEDGKDEDNVSGGSVESSEESDEAPRRRRSSRLNGESPPLVRSPRKKRRVASGAQRVNSKARDPQQLARRKEERRQELIKGLLHELSDRVLEWTNTAAIEALGHSHYETQRKRGPRPKRAKT